MTYIAGWKSGTSAYLIGDMAKTGGVTEYAGSSFGQKQHQFMGYNVGESALKVIPISPGVALAFAGDMIIAENLTRFIIDHFDGLASPYEMFEAMERSNGPFDQTREVQIILASTGAGKSPALIHWSSLAGFIERDCPFANAGSLDPKVAKHAREVITGFCDSTEEEHLLARITSSVQLYGFHADLMAQGVGGPIWGLRVSEGQTIWQDDTAYVVYEDVGINASQFVLAAMRHEVLCVNSSFTKQLRYFGHPFLSDKPLNQWRHDMWEKLPHGFGADFDVDKWRYCAAYALAEKRVAFIRRESIEAPSRHFKFTPESRSVIFLGEMTGLLRHRVSSASKMGYGYIVDRPGVGRIAIPPES